MRWRTCFRTTSFVGMTGFLLYIIIFRRHSPRVFLTTSDINEFTKKKNSNSINPPRIPRIIHQTWKTCDIPARWNRTVQSVRRLNANQFEYRLWTDEDMHKFVRHEEPYLYQNTFLKYLFNIQRVDAFRYIVLHRFGGIYIDLDNGCSRSLESLLNVLEAIDPQTIHLAAFPRTRPIGITNGFMISTKGHPFFKILVSRLSLFNHNYLINYLTVMISAGPSYLSINEFYFDTSFHQSAVRIIDEIVYSFLYTWHTTGSSWHGQSDRVIVYIYHSLRRCSSRTLYCSLFAVSFITLLFLYRYCFRRSHQKL